MKRERSESPSRASEVESLKAEIAGLKALLRDAEDRIGQIEGLVGKIDHQASQVNLLYPCMEYHTKEIALTKARVQDAENQITDLQAEATLDYQHTRALEMAIQKLADASPANRRVDVRDEIENFSNEGYHYYLAGRNPAQNGQDPVSDPQLGS